MPGPGEKGGGTVGHGAGTENADAQSVPLFGVWRGVLPCRASSLATSLSAVARLESNERSFWSGRPGGLFHEDSPMSANYELRGDVAVITMDNPPVNGLGYDTRRGIVDGL